MIILIFRSPITSSSLRNPINMVVKCLWNVALTLSYSATPKSNNRFKNLLMFFVQQLCFWCPTWLSFRRWRWRSAQASARRRSSSSSLRSSLAQSGSPRRSPRRSSNCRPSRRGLSRRPRSRGRTLNVNMLWRCVTKWRSKRPTTSLRHRILHFKADSHWMQRSAFSAVDWVNTEIENILSLCGNATVHCGICTSVLMTKMTHFDSIFIFEDIFIDIIFSYQNRLWNSSIIS